jgi:hypothetical protein
VAKKRKTYTREEKNPIKRKSQSRENPNQVAKKKTQSTETLLSVPNQQYPRLEEYH